MEYKIEQYLEVIEKSFDHKEAFKSVFDKILMIEKKSQQKHHSISKVCAYCLLALTLLCAVGFFYYATASLVVWALGAIFSGYVAESVSPKKSYEKVHHEFAQMLNANPALLKDISKLSVDKEGDFFLQDIISNVMHSKTDYSFERFTGLMDNYLLYQERLQRNQVKDAFLAQVGGKNPFLNRDESKNKLMEML